LNLEKYNQTTAPIYDLKNITEVPIAMFSGKYDRIVDINVNRNMSATIEAVVEHNELEADHLSFLTGKDTSYLDRVV